MNKTLITTWFFLIALSISAALVSGIQGKYIAILILLFASLKFLGVAFHFMELKKAHVMWKGLILIYLVLFIVLTTLFK